ncbi:MAG TPA: TlpA disulfide reductase family protein [Flavobacteriales bacterium]|nr:TlpA disulfide reductase family protein [Flavobacteriales bacterium]
MKKIIVFLIAFSTLTACGGGGKGKLSGTIKNARDQNLIFEKIENNAPVALDTVKLDETGKFSFEIPDGKINFYRLILGANNFVVLCLDSSNTPEVNGDAKDLMATYTVKGSKNSEIIHDYFAEINPLLKQQRELDNSMRGMNFGDTVKVNTMRAQMNDLIAKIGTITKKYIDNNPESPALVVMQSLNPETDLDYYKKIEKAVAKSMPNSFFHNQVSTYISQIEYNLQQMQQQKEMDKLLSGGMPMPDIKLPGLDGKDKALSALMGKVVLVDFWASWCRPCRAENPNVVRLYNKYNKKGFEVFSVSLDKDKNAWEAAITKDGLIWPNHVSDLQQWQSVVVKQFGIQGIPYTILVGRDGKIITKNLRGADLEAKLAELFGK